LTARKTPLQLLPLFLLASSVTKGYIACTNQVPQKKKKEKNEKENRQTNRHRTLLLSPPVIEATQEVSQSRLLSGARCSPYFQPSGQLRWHNATNVISGATLVTVFRPAKMTSDDSGNVYVYLFVYFLSFFFFFFFAGTYLLLAITIAD
jgi:hypothetical protein